MVEASLREKDFNLHTWYSTIPMMDDIYLGLHAQTPRASRSTLPSMAEQAIDGDIAASQGSM
jgi:hypothetical protein